MIQNPLFTLCHASARPNHWKDCYNDWWSACDDPQQVEYVLAVDARWGFTPNVEKEVNAQTKVLWCTHLKRGSTTAWNAAAAAAHGKVLIMVADDLRPPQHWDTELKKVLPEDLDQEFVIEVSSAELPDRAGLMVAYLLSRKRYENLGYVLNPNYISLYADNEYGDHARKDGVVISARHLRFRHYHPYYGDALFPKDDVYEQGNTRAAAVQGAKLYQERKALGFPRIPRPLGVDRVTVITPTIPSRARLLEEAKRSVRMQTYPNVEHFVEEDREGVGQGFVRNRLAAKSTAEWLVFLDDDDLLDPTFVELHLVHAAATRADLGYSICRLPNGYTAWKPRTQEFDAALLVRPGHNYIPVTVLLRRRFFEKVGGFKVPGSLDDWTLWRDLLREGARFSYLPQVLWSYRVHGRRM
jgi:glycosyltransferase involved in cell wall biosynthesis